MTARVEIRPPQQRTEPPFVTAILPRLIADRTEAPHWLAALRSHAADWFREHGLPDPGEEAWRFTSLRPVARLSPSLIPANVTIEHAVPPGVKVQNLQEAAGRLEPYCGQLGSTHNAFCAINTALFSDALVIEVEPGAVVERPIEILHLAQSGAGPTMSLPRVLVIAGKGSQLQLVERYRAGSGTALVAGVTEVFVEENAGVEHVRILRGAPDAHNISLTAVRQARNSRYTSRVATFGGALSRLDLRVLLDGEGAECTLDGLYLAGNGEHVDHQTFIDHARAHCTSHEKYKGVLQSSGRAVFDGGIVVRHGAQQTNAHQENRNLVLSDQAQINTKPGLVIDADDVKCSHGATVGQLDPAALFYLRARGIGATEARALLAFAFTREMTDRVSLPVLRRELVDAVLERMPEGRQIAWEESI